MEEFIGQINFSVELEKSGKCINTNQVSQTNGSSEKQSITLVQKSDEESITDKENSKFKVHWWIETPGSLEDKKPEIIEAVKTAIDSIKTSTSHEIVDIHEGSIIIDTLIPNSIFQDDDALRQSIRQFLDNIVRFSGIDITIPSVIKVKITITEQEENSVKYVLKEHTSSIDEAVQAKPTLIDRSTEVNEDVINEAMDNIEAGMFTMIRSRVNSRKALRVKQRRRYLSNDDSESYTMLSDKSLILLEEADLEMTETKNETYMPFQDTDTQISSNTEIEDIESKQTTETSSYTRLGVVANAHAMWRLQQQNKLCDVEFRIGRNKRLIRAHKNVLACGSRVFLGMFTGQFKEGTIRIPNIDPDAFIEILRYLYIDTCQINFANVDQILDCAEKYGLVNLKGTCCQYLSCNMTPDTIWQIFYMADLYLRHTELLSKCFNFYESHSVKCLESSFIVDLPKTLFCEIVEHNCVSCREERIYEACLRWASNQLKTERADDKDIREQLIRSDILYKIRFRWIRKKYFEKNISKRQILSEEEIILIHRAKNDDNVSDELFYPDIRRPKSHRLLRCLTRFDRNWTVGRTDAIDILFKGVVLLQGIIVFGTVSGESSYKVDLCIKDKERTISVLKNKELNTNVAEPLYEILLKKPLKLKSNYRYTIELYMEGSCTLTGMEYEKEVSDGIFEVTFINSSHSMNGTRTTAGQIPGVIVSNLYEG